jgi:hypothetical protein
MTGMTVRADEIRPGDDLWTRTWYSTGMQPDEIRGWRTVESVKVATRVVITMADGQDGGSGPPKTVWRFPTDQVRVRRPSPETA